MLLKWSMFIVTVNMNESCQVLVHEIRLGSCRRRHTNHRFWPSHVCVSEGKKCSNFGKFGVLCFLETPVLRFVLLPYYRRNREFTYAVFLYSKPKDVFEQRDF